MSTKGRENTVATTADFKNGLVLKVDGKLQQIIEFQHVKPGKGPAFVRTKLKDVVTGKTVDKTWNAGVKVETATVDRRDMTYLYNDGTNFVVMDDKTFEQYELSPEAFGDAGRFLLENMRVQVSFHEGEALFGELPISVDLRIDHTEPGLQGDRSTGGTKPATLETGAEIQVPLFLETGNVVKVDTRTGEYLSRVNN
nr:elongation factor P [Corynebacterium stercoris]